jgi:hypothetical protein
MSKKRNYTRELLKARQSGKVVVCSWQPFENRKMLLKPRSAFDPMPWVVDGIAGEWRYSGRDCHAINPDKVVTG